MSSTTAKVLLLSLAVFVIGSLTATGLHWTALTNRAVYHSDIRQSPHWAAYHQDTFRSDDLLLQYGRFNESPLQNLIYYVGTYFIEMVQLTKVLSVLSYGLGSLLFFLLTRAMFGTRCGLLAALFFTFFPDQFDYSSGFFSKFWKMPLLLVCLFCLRQGHWRYLGPLMGLAALAYPPAAVMLVITTGLYTLLTWRQAPHNRTPLGRNLVVGCVLILIALLPKYLQPAEAIGPMTPGHILAGMVEMYRGGLTYVPYLPTKPLHLELLRHIRDPFILFSSIAYLWFLGVHRIAWDDTWTAAFGAGCVGYILADLLFFRLYFPDRYSSAAMAVLLILWNARNIDLILERIDPGRFPWGRWLLVLLLVIVAGFAYRDNFNTRRDVTDRRPHAAVCRFIGQLPSQSLIAGPPTVMDDVPVLSKRSVLCNKKLAHPWFTTYYAEIKKRTADTLRALYAGDATPINKLHEVYGVTHLVAARSDYLPDTLKRRTIYAKPYDGLIRRLTHKRTDFLLQHPPADAILYRDDDFMVITLPLADQSRPGAVQS